MSDDSDDLANRPAYQRWKADRLRRLPHLQQTGRDLDSGLVVTGGLVADPKVKTRPGGQWGYARKKPGVGCQAMTFCAGKWWPCMRYGRHSHEGQCFCTQHYRKRLQAELSGDEDSDAPMGGGELRPELTRDVPEPVGMLEGLATVTQTDTRLVRLVALHPWLSERFPVPALSGLSEGDKQTLLRQMQGAIRGRQGGGELASAFR